MVVWVDTDALVFDADNPFPGSSNSFAVLEGDTHMWCFLWAVKLNRVGNQVLEEASQAYVIAHDDWSVVDGDGDTLRRRDIGADEYTVFSIAPSAQSPAAGAMFTVDATTAAPSSLLGGILLVSLDRDDVFLSAFGQLQVGLVDFLSFDLSSGTVQLTNPGALGLSVHAQAIGILDDGASGAFVQLSNPIELRLQ